MFEDQSARKSAEAKVRSEKRLPPGQSLTNRFPVLHYGPVPEYKSLDNWTFQVFGAVEEEKTWSWQAFNELPRKEITLDLHCVTRWSKFDTRWEGVSLKSLVDGGWIRPKPTARYIIQRCEYGYTTNLPLEFLLQDNFLMATHYDGQPITPDHGYPLRGVVGSFSDRTEPKTAYLWKGGKWLRGLEFSETDKPGFWENSGYHNEADPWREQRHTFTLFR